MGEKLIIKIHYFDSQILESESASQISNSTHTFCKFYVKHKTETCALTLLKNFLAEKPEIKKS